MMRKLLVLIFLFLAAQAAAHKLELKRHEGKTQRLLKEGKFEEFRTLRDASLRQLKSLSKQNTVHTRANRFTAEQQPIFDYFDEYYTTEVSIGTPPQKFNLLVDSFFGDTWVADITCRDIICQCPDPDSQYCYPKTEFNSNKSSTYRKSNITFDDQLGGQGFAGLDTISLAPGLDVRDVAFGQADNPNSYFNAFPFDGILGLNEQYQGRLDAVVRVAADQGLLDKPIYTIYVVMEGFSARDELAGQITYGSVDLDHCSPDVTYAKVLSPIYWTFQIGSTEIGGLTHSSPDWKAITDYNVNFIGLPKVSFDDLLQATGAYYDESYGSYRVDCGIKFSFNLFISGQKFSIDQSNSLLRPHKDVCLLAFEESYGGDANFNFYLGRAFTTKYCQVFDLAGQIGFAEILPRNSG